MKNLIQMILLWILIVVGMFYLFVWVTRADTCCEKHPEGAKCYPCKSAYANDLSARKSLQCATDLIKFSAPYIAK